MRNTRLIAWRELRQRIGQRGFIISTLALPIIVIFIWGLTSAMGGEEPLSPIQEVQEQGPGSVGFVDEADLIRVLPPSLPENTLVPYSNAETARRDLESGMIDAYYIIPPHYRETGELRRMSKGLPLMPADAEAFRWLLISNIFPARPPQEVARMQWPFDGDLEYVSLTPDEGGRGPLAAMAPLAVAVVTIAPLFASGQMIFQSLVKEKEKRVLEILLASTAPHDLLIGKMVGLGAVALVQYALWFLIGLIAAAFAGVNPLEQLGSLQLSARELTILAPYIVGCFLLYAGLMAGLGALAPEAEGSRVTLFLIALPMVLPIYLISAIAGAPHGLLATALSLIPFSAPIAMIVRMTSVTVPAWQVALSLSLLFVTAVSTIWLMARLFRAKTLLSGEGLSIRRFVTAVVEG